MYDYLFHVDPNPMAHLFSEVMFSSHKSLYYFNQAETLKDILYACRYSYRYKEEIIHLILNDSNTHYMDIIRRDLKSTYELSQLIEFMHDSDQPMKTGMNQSYLLNALSDHAVVIKLGKDKSISSIGYPRISQAAIKTLRIITEMSQSEERSTMRLT
jgi:hypothetical protein